MIAPLTLAAMIDQTWLKPAAPVTDALRWIEESASVGFAALCVPPFLTERTEQRLAGSPTRTCTVCGFPFGFEDTADKAAQARHLVGLGAQEVDVVMNIAAMIDGDHDYVRKDLAAVATAVVEASDSTATLKVILETGYLGSEQIARASEIAVLAGAHFVKTSTGFGPRGASVADIETIRVAIGPEIGIKASGGIRDLDAALELIEAGATRIGTSAGIEIISSAQARWS
ncbi:MAG: deoxyribose-phosphate aldolase [Actinobacteria bacterium]|nr:deoxyribose-phosphate aldolase [Actinomycetota bacterium]